MTTSLQIAETQLSIQQQFRIAKARSKQLLERDWDESKHPRVPAGGPGGGQFGHGGGAGDAGFTEIDDEKLLLVSEFPSQEKLDRWNEQLNARAEELTKQGQAGNAEDDQISRMQTALAKFSQEPDANLQSGEAGLNAVYDGNMKLKAAAFTYLRDKVATISSFGAIDHAAGVKALQQVAAKFAKGSDQIEATLWRDDGVTRAIYEEAGFKQRGEPDSGTITMVKTELPGGGATTTERELKKLAVATAKKLGFNPQFIIYTDEARKFELASMSYNYAGSYQFGEPTIKLYMGQLNEDNIKGVTAHEIGHRKFDLLTKMRKIENEMMMQDPGPPPDPNHPYWWGRKGGSDAIMNPQGEMRPPYDKKYPIVHECCLLYTSPSPRDGLLSRMPSSA